MEKTIFAYARALRVNQWIKNLVVFSAILFAGKLFDTTLVIRSSIAFGIFCLLSSTSYVLNDIMDYQYDVKHPLKKFRPIAAGLISIPQATFTVFILTLSSLIISLFFSLPFFFLALIFILLHFLYSLYLKRFPVIDIFTISLSFILRALGGVVASGYHIPIWLLLTVFFISIFMAAVKRHAELVAHGQTTRVSMDRYKEHLLYFLSTTFATLTIVSYAMYSYTLYIDQQSNFTQQRQTKCEQINITAAEKAACQQQGFNQLFPEFVPSFQARKLMMLTIPFVVYGIARYAQLLYEQEQGERPEKIITTDKPLIITIFLWAVSLVLLIYVF